MARSNRNMSRQPKSERRLSVRSVRRDPIDARKLARALLAIAAAAQAEKEAEQQDASVRRTVGADAGESTNEVRS